MALGVISLAGCHFDTDPNSTGVASSASAGAGSTAAGVTLHWEMPTENTNGTPLTDLQGYTIVYGESPASMNRWVQISDIGMTSYSLSDLRPGTWYFAILSYTTSGVNSALSNVVSKTIS